MDDTEQNPVSSEDTNDSAISDIEMTLVNESKFTKVVDGGGASELNAECGDNLKGIVSFANENKQGSAPQVYGSNIVYSSMNNPSRRSEDTKAVSNFLASKTEYDNSISSFFRDYCLGGFTVKYVIPVTDIEMKKVDTYRVVITLEGQSEWLNPVVHIVGQKGGNYFNMTKTFEYDSVAQVATTKKCPLYGTDLVKASELPDKCMNDLITADTGVQKLLAEGAKQLATDFEFVK